MLNNNNFINSFPKFSFTYSNNFHAYKQIASDNCAFMGDYDHMSLFKKVPMAYRKLSQNYGAVDYKDLDPNKGNIF